MTRINTTPTRIEWVGPEGARVVLDEDGIRLDLARCGGMEENALRILLDLIAQVEEYRAGNAIPAPVVPTPEQRRAICSDSYRTHRITKAVTRVINEEF